MITRRRLTQAGAATLAAAWYAAPSLAQQSRGIKFVVPFAAGSATDSVARIVGDHVARTLGQSVVTENVVGASGILAAQNVARARPDGNTVLITTNTTHGANQSLLKTVPYDAVNDFEPVAKIGTIALALVVHPSVPARSVKELVAYAKANPGKLAFGYGSSSARIAGEMLKTLAGLDITAVSYRSNPQAVTDLLGGHIGMMFADISTTLPQVNDKRVVGLAVSTGKRSVLAPDLPTMAEAGVNGYDLAAWFAAFLPAKTPKPVADKLSEAVIAAVADKSVQERLLAAGVEPQSSTAEELRVFVGAEIKKWADIVKAAGIQPE